MKFLQCSVILLSLAPLCSIASPLEIKRAKGVILVQPKKDGGKDEVEKTLAGAGARIKAEISAIGVKILAIREENFEKISEALAKSGHFEFVEPDYLARSEMTPDDPQYAFQWHLPKIMAPQAWSVSTGSWGVPIAVIDSGVDSTHPDLVSKVLPGWSFLGNNADTSDVLGHGTVTAGTAAAATNNSTGVAGVAWSNPIVPLVVLSSSNWATYSDIASAITYAADHGVRIASISISGTSPSSTLQKAVNYAWNKGTVVFAAAGNANSSSPMYPAACDKVVAVSSTSASDSRSGFSNYGNWISLAAPGESILTPSRGGGYSYHSGTSLSTPIAAAVAALVLSVNPSLAKSGLVNLMEQNTDDLGDPGFDPYFGWGRVNAFNAVSAAMGGQPDITKPTVTMTTPPPGASVSGIIQVQGTAIDNVGVTKIELYAGNQFVSSAASSPFSLPYNTTGVANGPLTLTVKAYDAANNIGSASASVTVNNPTENPGADTQPPSVTILTPSASEVVAVNQNISVAATDNVGVTQVRLLINNTILDIGSGSSLTCRWKTNRLSAGNYVIRADVMDAQGNIGSASITVVVQ
jgi:thermitase